MTRGSIKPKKKKLTRGSNVKIRLRGEGEKDKSETSISGVHPLPDVGHPRRSLGERAQCSPLPLEFPLFPAKCCIRIIQIWRAEDPNNTYLISFWMGYWAGLIRRPKPDIVVKETSFQVIWKVMLSDVPINGFHYAVCRAVVNFDPFLQRHVGRCSPSGPWNC